MISGGKAFVLLRRAGFGTIEAAPGKQLGDPTMATRPEMTRGDDG
jgi:hypothetical protein